MKILATAIALTLGAAAFPASADPGTHSIEVTYEDLNLASSAGLATLDKRIAIAVRKVCNVKWTRSIRAGTVSRKCIRETKQDIAPVRDEVVARARAEAVGAGLAHKSR